MAMGEARVPVLHEQRRGPQHNEPLSVKSSPPVAHRPLGGGAAVVTSLLAGAAAGALAKTTIAPLDRTKINFQTSHTPYSAQAALEFLRNTLVHEGPRALWRGNSATMARIVPYAAIQFTAHEQWKRVLRVDNPTNAKSHPLLQLLAGSLAGVTSQSLTYPLDLARARMAVTHARQYRTLSAVFVKVWRDEGPRALYRGYPATVLGVIPYAGASFFTYDTLKQKYAEVTGTAAHGVTNMVFGGCAGALGQTASYPLDIVRRRMQTAGTGRCETIPSTLHEVYSHEGWRGFFKGLSMNWVKGPIAVGISFATYDAIKTFLRDLAVNFS